MNFHVQSPLFTIFVHHLDDLVARYEFSITGSQFVFAGRNLLPAFARERRMFHRIPSSISEKLASRVEALFVPRRIDVFEKRFTESEIDLDHFRAVIAVRAVYIRRDPQA